MTNQEYQEMVIRKLKNGTWKGKLPKHLAHLESLRKQETTNTTTAFSQEEDGFSHKDEKKGITTTQIDVNYYDELLNGSWGSHEYRELLLQPRDAKDSVSFLDKEGVSIVDSAARAQGRSGFMPGMVNQNTRWLTFNIQQIDILTRSNPHVRNAINYLASLPLINGIDINSPKDKISSEEIYQVNKTIKNLYRSLKDASTKAYTYGGGAALMYFSRDTEDDLKTPLVITAIKKDSFVGLKPLSRWYGIEPALELGVITEVGAGTGFNDAYMLGTPKYYWVSITGGLGGLTASSLTTSRVLVHASRLILMNTENPSVIETQIERYWGPSLIELMYNDLTMDRRLWNATTKSAEKNNMGIMKIKNLGLVGTLNDVVRDRVKGRLSLIKEASSYNVIPMGNDDDFEFAQAVLSGQADVLRLSNSRLAGSARVPVSVMFPGEVSDNEDRLYIQSRTNAQDFQERILRPGFETLIQVIIKSITGRQVKDVTFTFNPIETQTLIEKSNMFKHMTDGLRTLYDIGLDKASIINMMDDIAKDPTNIAQNINNKYREFILDKAERGEFETKNSDQILVAKELNQQKELDDERNGLAGIHSPESDIGGNKGGNPKESKQPMGRNPLNREKAKK